MLTSTSSRPTGPGRVAGGAPITSFIFFFRRASTFEFPLPFPTGFRALMEGGRMALRVRLVAAVFPHAASYFVGLQLGSDATQKKKTERAPRSVAPSFERNTFVWTLPVGDAEVDALLQGNLHLGAYVAPPAAEMGQGATTPPKRKSRQLGSATVALGSLSASLRAGVTATTQCAFMRRSSRTDHHDAPVGSAMIEVQLFASDDATIDTVVESPIDCLEVSILGVRVSGAKAGLGAAPTLRLQARALNAVAAKAVEEADRAHALAAERDGPPSDALAAIVRTAADACRATTIVAVSKAVQCDAAAGGASAGADEAAEPGAWVCDWNSKLWVSVPTALGRTDPDAPAAALASSAAIRIELAELIGASESTSKPSRARFAPVAGFSVPVADVEAGRQYRVRIRVHASRSAAKLTKLFPDGVTELDVDIDVAFEIHRAAPFRARAIECYEAGVIASAAVVAAAAAGVGAGVATNEEEHATSAAAVRTKACAAMLKNSLAVLTLLSAEARAQLKPAAVEKLPAPITQCASTAELHQLLRADSTDGQAAGMKPLPTLRSLDRTTLRSSTLLAATGAGRLASADALPATSVRFCLNEGTSTSAAATQVGFPLPDESAPAVLVRFFSRDARGFYATLAGYGVAPLPASHAKDGATITCALPLQFVGNRAIENESDSIAADDACVTVALRRFAGASAAERLAGESSAVGFDERAAGSLDGAQLIQLWCAGNKVRDTLRKKRGMVSALQGAAGMLLAASKKTEEAAADADLEVSSDGEGASTSLASAPASPVGAVAAEAEAAADVDVAAVSPKSTPASAVAGDEPPAMAETKEEVEAAAAARPQSPSPSATSASPARIASPLPQPVAAAQPIVVSPTRPQPQRAANVPSTNFSAQDISSALTTPSRTQQQLINTQQQLVQAQQQLAAASVAQAESRVAVDEKTSRSAHDMREIAHTESAVRHRINDAVREMAEKLAAAENKAARAEASAARAEEKASSIASKLGEEREQRAAASAACDAAVDARTLIENQLASLNSDVAHKRALIDRLTTEVDDRAAALRRCSVEVLHLQRANDKLARDASELQEKTLRDGKAQIRAGEDALVSDNELDQVISLAAVGAASSDPAATDLVLRSGRAGARLDKDVVHRLRVVTSEHRDAERRSKRAQGEMAQIKRQLVGSRLVVERLRKLEKAHMTQQRALQQLQVRQTLALHYGKDRLSVRFSPPLLIACCVAASCSPRSPTFVPSSRPTPALSLAREPKSRHARGSSQHAGGGHREAGRGDTNENRRVERRCRTTRRCFVGAAERSDVAHGPPRGEGGGRWAVQQPRS